MSTIVPTSLLAADKYIQPDGLCGPTCVMVVYDWIHNSFSNSSEDFLNRIYAQIRPFTAKKKFNDYSSLITLDELNEIATNIGLCSEVCHIKNIINSTIFSEKEFVIVKTEWSNFPLTDERPDSATSFDMQSEHYLMVFQINNNIFSCWEPSFSGNNKNPILTTSLSILIEGNLKLRESSERGKALIIRNILK